MERIDTVGKFCGIGIKYLQCEKGTSADVPFLLFDTQKVRRLPVLWEYTYKKGENIRFLFNMALYKSKWL